MVSFPSTRSYKFKTFKGIRTRNGIADNGVISATVCQNVDFAPSSYDAGVVIRSSLGNYKKLELSGTYADYTVIKGFEFESEGIKHLLFYCENSINGVLLELGTNNQITEILGSSYDLSATGEANGVTLIDNAYNTFVFTNGIEYFAYCPDGNTVLQQLNPQYNGSDVTGLAMCEQDGSLVIGCNEGLVLASRKGDITDFDYVTPTDTNKPWYQLFGKKVTAVVPYIDALLVFTEEDSTVLSGNMSDTSTAVRADASLGGCMSFESWCKHDKYLFFYDDRQKNIYYYMQNNYGQKVLGEPLAPEVQKFFNNVSKLQMVSYIGNNRSEIWLLSDSFKLIYDYFVGEWSERKCQDLTSYFVYNNEIYSTGGKKIFHEKAGNIGFFDDKFYTSCYTTQIINLNSFSNLKEMEMPPLLSVTADFNNTFYLDCLINGKKTKSKYITSYLNGAIWASDDDVLDASTPTNKLWDLQYFPKGDTSIITQLKGKMIPSWYYLQFTIRTAKAGDDFSICCFELKGITEETDTLGKR